MDSPTEQDADIQNGVRSSIRHSNRTRFAPQIYQAGSQMGIEATGDARITSSMNHTPINGGRPTQLMQPPNTPVTLNPNPDAPPPIITDKIRSELVINSYSYLLLSN